jgi:hypothetical protein
MAAISDSVYQASPSDEMSPKQLRGYVSYSYQHSVQEFRFGGERLLIRWKRGGNVKRVKLLMSSNLSLITSATLLRN